MSHLSFSQCINPLQLRGRFGCQKYTRKLINKHKTNRKIQIKIWLRIWLNHCRSESSFCSFEFARNTLAFWCTQFSGKFSTGIWMMAYEHTFFHFVSFRENRLVWVSLSILSLCWQHKKLICFDLILLNWLNENVLAVSRHLSEHFPPSNIDHSYNHGAHSLLLYATRCDYCAPNWLAEKIAGDMDFINILYLLKLSFNWAVDVLKIQFFLLRARHVTWQLWKFTKHRWFVSCQHGCSNVVMIALNVNGCRKKSNKTINKEPRESHRISEKKWEITYG